MASMNVRCTHTTPSLMIIQCIACNLPTWCTAITKCASRLLPTASTLMDMLVQLNEPSRHEFRWDAESGKMIGYSVASPTASTSFVQFVLANDSGTFIRITCNASSKIYFSSCYCGIMVKFLEFQSDVHFVYDGWMICLH